MGNKSRFHFPVPGRKPKQPEVQPSMSAPPTKAQKILGTVGINVDSSNAPRGGPLKQWDSRSGISISISESSAGYTSHDSGLGVVDEEDDATAGTSYGQMGWDIESEIIPRQLHGSRGLKAQRSAATLGHDYRTDASSTQRRQSTSSTISQHYDRNKVPLSISQQTSNSAMAKGFPNKAHSLLDMDGTLAGPVGKKKPTRLDLALLNPRGRKDRGSKAEPVLGNNYVMRSPSFVSQISPVASISSLNTSRRLVHTSPGIISTPPAGQRGTNDATRLHQLYDHYEQMSFLRKSPLAEKFPLPPNFEPSAAERTPALTTASTVGTTLAPPPSNPVIREPNRHTTHFRRDSSGSRDTITSVSSPSTLPSYVSPRQDYASSISSRNTRTSKTSRTLDSDFQQTSVLSLSDSDSDDGTLSDSAPKSSMSSYDKTLHDNASLPLKSRKARTKQPPVIQERVSSRSKHSNYAPMNDYLTIPAPSNKGYNGRTPSNSTLRSSSSSASTATATVNTSAKNGRVSVSATVTLDSTRTAQHSHWRNPPAEYGVHEAKRVSFLPSASSAEAALSPLDEPLVNSEDKHQSMFQSVGSERRTRNSDQPTPPLSPASADDSASSPELSRKNPKESKSDDAQNARLMAVTKQEEMLLAALRKKRARMRENIIAEIKGRKGSVADHGTSSSNGPSATRRVSAMANKAEAMETLDAPPGCPQLPPLPARSRSLVTSFKSLTERSGSATGRRTDNNVRFADQISSTSRSDLIDKRSSSAMSHTSLKTNNPGRRERVLMYLDRPANGFDDVDTAEPSPGLSEFLVMDFDQDSDTEILPDRRRSRSSRYGSVHGKSSSSGKRADGRPRRDSNPLRIQLENLPESDETNNDTDMDVEFDGFSDVMGSTTESRSGGRPKDMGVARPDSPVSGQVLKGHSRGKNSAVRLSAVGHGGGFPTEAGLWGDDG
ncbi:hypothetical protein BJ170DRAFT_173688 [Xylariales sp. AK1849]|nr:hypothetical protein BJ170DRAFT_173688 [Xylariales sp. AK1849]